MTVVFRTVVLITLLASVRPVLGQTAAGPSGHWEGTIHMPGQEVGVTVDVAKNPAGAWIGSMSVPMANAIDIPLSEISVKGARIQFRAELPGRPFFDAALSTDATSVAGDASNAQGAVPFELKRRGEASVRMPPKSSALPKAFEGTWQGTVDVGGAVMRIVLKLAPAADGTAVATMTNLDQGNQEIPVATVTLQGSELQLDARAVSGAYRGAMTKTGDIVGELVEGATRLPLTFKRAQ